MDPDTFGRAIMSVLGRLYSDIRTQVNSRSFWQRYGLPFVTVRRQVIAAARSIYNASQLAGSGTVGGTLADLYNQQGILTYPGGGGPFGTRDATVSAPIAFPVPGSVDEEGNQLYEYRTRKIDVPWDTPIGALEASLLGGNWNRAGSPPMGGGEVEWQGLKIY